MNSLYEAAKEAAHFDAEEAAEIGVALNEVIEAFHNCSPGRRCGDSVWSTTGKDADLEDWGCQQIYNVELVDYETVRVTFNVHKTFSSPWEWGLDLSDEEIENLCEVAQEIIFGCNIDGANWDASPEDWTCSVSEAFEFEPWDEDGNIRSDFSSFIENAYNNWVNPIQTMLEETSKAFDNLYNE